MKKLEINQIEGLSGGGHCGRDISASIIFGGMIGGPFGIEFAIVSNLLFNPACRKDFQLCPVSQRGKVFFQNLKNY